MFEVFQQYLQTKGAFTVQELDMIREQHFIKKLRRRQYLLQEGDVWKHYAFVSKGCLRIYYVDEKGVEHIMKFLTENWWAGDRESLLNSTPSEYYIDALEDAMLVMFTKENFERLCREIPTLNNMVNMLVHRSYVAANHRIHAAISFTTEEKYQHFIEKYPDLLGRVPLHMIASYIGVTPETLSRVRAASVKK
ncbi:Crp/Fnr family transcriptional regulator [Chitinophaga japonensis]|uniref:CRP-like cAMP-binding protein n=1 Tax=Chitinophaga japonensis TaxID=104662 RepID=A0A562TD81_CHIJA|nr:Crp/Fnr family transcriptional regulator [Chitinophaga japonensis]TWI91445.1 CRP-like cAMP-binding protein [Chitinophaga japonensis]